MSNYESVHNLKNTNKKILIQKDTQKKITDYFEYVKVYGYNSKTQSWHCLTCGVDMGPQNPRQLCGKWRCFYEDEC
jgi:hypothetical protein